MGEYICILSTFTSGTIVGAYPVAVYAKSFEAVIGSSIVSLDLKLDMKFIASPRPSCSLCPFSEI